MMGEEVKIQAEGINKILDDVEAARDNARNGEGLINDAERNSRVGMKKIIVLSIGIFLIVGFIIAVILLLILGKEN